MLGSLGEKSRNIIGSVFGSLCVEMFLTWALWKIRGFAFSISTSLDNQLTGLPVFTVNYVLQIMTLFWPACKMAWKLLQAALLYYPFNTAEWTKCISPPNFSFVFLCPFSRVNGRLSGRI